MKTFYTLLFLASMGAVASAQNDVSVSLNNYTSGEATSDDPLDLVFTITNEGTTPIGSGDTLYFTFVVGFQNYSMNLTPGSVSYVMLLSDFDPGTSFDLEMLLPPPTVMSMQWIYDERNSLTGDICAFAGVSAASLMLTPGADANYADNTMCVSYTVTEVAGLEGVGTSFLSVYPNPASDAVNFQLGNNEVSHINIFDLNGRLVQTIRVNGTLETISTEEIGSGIFYYQLMNGETLVATDKFVVTK